MLSENWLHLPFSVAVETEGRGLFTLAPGSSDAWSANGTEADLELSDNQVTLHISAPGEAVKRINLTWRTRLPSDSRVLGDHWERAYGDLEWKPVDLNCPLPWYFAAHHGGRTWCAGVKTQPAAMCFWTVGPDAVQLTCDVRSGVNGVPLGRRRLEVATIVTRAGDGSAFDVIRGFCRRLCTAPLLPAKPVYGFNDWYYSYASSAEATILRDAACLAELAPGGSNRPFCIVDAGWQVNRGINGGPWNPHTPSFPDMARLAAEMKNLGVRPGLWLRPLCSGENLPDAWRAGQNDAGSVLDPSIPDVLDHISNDIHRVTRNWGYELIKHDFSTFDILGLWGSEMGGKITSDKTLAFRDTTRTNAEIIAALYRAIRKAAGNALVIGCNTIGHLAAGLVEINRTGDDTSGKEWARTLKMGVNALAFRMPQHEAFFSADADCVGLTNAIPWSMNRKWLELLSRSGTPLFVSAAPDALGREQKDALKKAFELASKRQPAAEPLDWMETLTPRRWRMGKDTVTFDWSSGH